MNENLKERLNKILDRITSPEFLEIKEAVVKSIFIKA